MVKSGTVGVTVAAGISNIFIVLSRTTGVPGLITMDGLLSDAAGNAIDGVSVKLNINGQDKATFTTKLWYPYPLIPRNIWFEYTFPEGTFDVYVYWGGNATYQGCEGSLIRPTYAKIPTALSIAVSPKTGKPPLEVTISGILSDGAGNGLPDKTIEIYRNDTKIGTIASGSGILTTGAYVYKNTISSAGNYSYYAQFNGDATYAGCEEESEARETLPCPACGHPVDVRGVGVEVSCGFCGAASEIVVNG